MQYVKVGQKIRITFEGKTKSKRGWNVNLFKIEVSDVKIKMKDRTESGTTSGGYDPIPLKALEAFHGNIAGQDDDRPWRTSKAEIT